MNASLQSDSIGLLVLMVQVTAAAAAAAAFKLRLLLPWLPPILLLSPDKLPFFISDSAWVGILMQSLLLAMVIGIVLLLLCVDDIFCGGNGDSPNGVYSPNGIFGIQLSTRLFIKFVLFASAIKRSFMVKFDAW